MGALGAKWDDIPEWLRSELRENVEGSIGGVRWVASNHVAFAVIGGTWSVLPGIVGSIVQPASTRTNEVRLGAYVVDVHDGGLSPEGSNEAPELSHAGHYAITWPDVSIALYYAAVVQKLFGPVEWFGAGKHEPVIAKVDGNAVALVMPVRGDLRRLTIGETAAGAGAPHEATAEARGE